jgi:hypothetical protein
MTRPHVQSCTSEEVRALADMALPALRAAWRARWGEPPQLRSRDLLTRAFAHRVQVEAFGDLPAAVRRRSADYVQKFAADRKFTPTPGPVLKPGSALIREWGGMRHEVAVVADGFVYQGQTYRSLSPIAQRITGVKWNGLVFFGLKARAARAA